jgi:hypothetical protein
VTGLISGFSSSGGGGPAMLLCIRQRNSQMDRS